VQPGARGPEAGNRQIVPVWTGEQSPMGCSNIAKASQPTFICIHLSANNPSWQLFNSHIGSKRSFCAA
jgi:hypothetical protein